MIVGFQACVQIPTWNLDGIVWGDHISKYTLWAEHVEQCHAIKIHVSF